MTAQANLLDSWQKKQRAQDDKIIDWVTQSCQFSEYYITKYYILAFDLSPTTFDDKILFKVTVIIQLEGFLELKHMNTVKMTFYIVLFVSFNITCDIQIYIN